MCGSHICFDCSILTCYDPLATYRWLSDSLHLIFQVLLLLWFTISLDYVILPIQTNVDISPLTPENAQMNLLFKIYPLGLLGPFLPQPMDKYPQFYVDPWPQLFIIRNNSMNK